MERLQEKYKKEVIPAMMKKFGYKNPMAVPSIKKVVLNSSFGKDTVGKSASEREKTQNLIMQDLSLIAGQHTNLVKSKKSIAGFKLRENLEIAAVVTLRKQKAIDFLKKVLPVVDNKVSKRSFDLWGNFAFGLKEHIEIPGVKYDPEIGIFGMDICVSVNRPGQRLKTRRKQNKRIGPKHMLTPEESILFVKQTLGAEIV